MRAGLEVGDRAARTFSQSITQGRREERQSVGPFGALR